MACRGILFQALAHPNIPSRYLPARGVSTTRRRGLKDSWASSGQEKLQKAIEVEADTEVSNQSAEDIAAINQIDTTNGDGKVDSQSDRQLSSHFTRLDPPMAFNNPAYSGVILPFPHKRTSEEDGDIFKGTKRIDLQDAMGEDPFLESTGRTPKAIPVVCETVPEIRARRRKVTQDGGTIGFVPTMGALHQGHLDLMRAAANRCSEVWVSIYVNPTQFGANEDLSTYPSTWQADLDKIEELNNSLLSLGGGHITTIFRPRAAQVLYPYGVEGTSHVIINPELTQILEGSSRPTFFRGVTTIVMKLLNIVQPDRTFFGQKDIQQFAVINRMINEFHLPVFLERVATTRELSGLAMSSRNAYLGSRRLKVASVLYKMLLAAKKKFESTPQDKRTRSLLIDTAMELYTAEVEYWQKISLTKPEKAVEFKLDYLSLADPDTMQEIRDKVGRNGAVMSLAIVFQPLAKGSITKSEKLGINGDQTAVRLIDNELLGVDKPTIPLYSNEKVLKPGSGSAYPELDPDAEEIDLSKKTEGMRITRYNVW